jgi:ketosteroid isomerase-like protein
MIKLLSLLLLLLIFMTLGFPQEAQKPAAAPGATAIQSMVDTERAFARMSEEQGTRPAFMAFIADDGILFRPSAVQGKQWLKDHSVPASDKRPLLTWYPAIAGMSRMTDLGYTTGPWEYKADVNDATPVAWGTFLTVWKREPDRSWKFAIDLGISHPKPEQSATAWQLPHDYHERRMVSTRDVKLDTDKLLARDREFSAASATRGARAAFADYAAPDVRVYRDGSLPFVGREAATAALPAPATVWTWEPTAAQVSHSNDLGYTYGSYKMLDKGPALKFVESGNYFRIWKSDDNGWQILFDVTNVVPQEPNKN